MSKQKLKLPDIDFNMPITTRAQYDEVRTRVNELIKEATQKGMLEPNADNEYICEISRLAKLCAEYEDNHLNVLPLKVKSL